MFSAITASTFLAASAVPTPLYRHYQEAFHFSPGILTTIFAVYAASLLAARLMVGSLSDYVGRRPVVFASLLLNAVAIVVFMEADSGLALGLARLIQGFATGMATTALGAAIMDADRARGPMLNGVTAFAGLFVGALLSGALVTYGPDPTTLVYALVLLVTLSEAIVVWWMPETAHAKPGVLASLLPVIHLPRQVRDTFLSIMPVNAAGWALGGLTLSLIPAVVRNMTGNSSPMVGAFVVAAVMLGAALAVFSLRNQSPRVVLTVGPAFLAGGMALTTLAIYKNTVPLMFVAMLAAGAGFGGSFSGAMRELLPRAVVDERAGLLSVLYVESYAAFSIPVVIAGIAVSVFGLLPTVEVYAAALIVLASFSLVRIAMQQRS